MRNKLYNGIACFCLGIWFCAIVNVTCSAQSSGYVSRHITADNGLVNNSVKFIFQDSRGYMWIGTQGGLQRYDGYRFVTYRADFHNPDALQTDWISTLFEDSRHRFWVGTDKGSAYILDRDRGKFYDYNRYVATEENAIKNVWQFCEDGNGDIWVAASNGFFKLNSQTNQFENLSNLFGLDSRIKASGVAKDKQGNIWLSTTGGLQQYDVKTKKVYGKHNNPLRLPVFDIEEGISNVSFDSNNNIWISTGYHHILYRYNYGTKNLSQYFKNMDISRFYPTLVANEVVGTMYETRAHKFYLGLVPLGLAAYDAGRDTFEIIGANNIDPYSIHLDAELYASIMVTDDNENNIWIGTDKGINIYNPSKHFFTEYGQGDTKNGGRKNISLPVNSFLQTPADGDIYVPYYYPGGGISRYDSNLNFKEHYLLKSYTPRSDSNEIWCLYQDDKGIIWAPNQQGEILKLNPKTGAMAVTSDATLAGNINFIKNDADSNAWIGHWNKGLIKIDHANGKYVTYSNQPVKNVACMLFDTGGLAWIGSRNDGLWLFDTKKGRFIQGYTYNQQGAASISNNNISDILALNQDTLIIATLSGVNIFDKRKKTFSVISSKDGLPDNMVLSVALDKQKNLWVTCVSGICKANIYTRAVTKYDITDGVLETDFSGAFLSLKNGKLLAAGSKGFVAFNPAEIPAAKPPPNVTITGFWVFDKKLDIDSVTKAGTGVRLAYTENSLRIEFSSLQFTSPDNVKYYYQLEGVDKNWVLAGKEQVASYNQLRNGNYVFKIRATNREGLLSAAITSLGINIIPPFWKQWWFVTLMILAAIGLMYWFIKWREQNIRTIEAEKTKVQELTALQYKNQLELEQVSNFFSTSLINNSNIDDVLWDVAKKLIGKLGFVDCMIYLWNDDKTKLVQKAGYGPKGSFEEMQKLPFDVAPGQGVVGYVAQKKEAVIIPDTRADPRYRMDEMMRKSEICVPIVYNEELLGIIDSEHYHKGFFTSRHLQILNTIATLIAGKIKAIESASALQQRKEELDNVQHQLAQVQLSALRSQMNPHFIFNSLNSINTFILQNDQDNASEYLNKFSQLMRMILDNSRSEWVLLENELKALELYIQLEALRFDNAFTYNIRVSGDVHAAGIVVPPLIIQPYVENAIWHGLMHRREPGGKLAITITRANNVLLIQIEDNGVGREAAALKRKKSLLHKSHGMKITAERLAVVNDVYKVNAGVMVTDLKDTNEGTNGTSVLLTIQYKRNESNID